MPIWTVTANGILVYQGDNMYNARRFYSEARYVRAFDVLYHCGIMLMCSDRVPAQNSRV